MVIQGVDYIPGSHITQGVQRLIGGLGMWPTSSAFGRNLQGALCVWRKVRTTFVRAIGACKERDLWILICWALRPVLLRSLLNKASKTQPQSKPKRSRMP